jgi:hypothetical protein
MKLLHALANKLGLCSPMDYFTINGTLMARSRILNLHGGPLIDDLIMTLARCSKWLNDSGEQSTTLDTGFVTRV